MNEKPVYKIFREADWKALQANKRFAGSADDKRDGFIHLSAKHQMQGTLDKHYAPAKIGGEAVIIAAVPMGPLGAALRWEVSRGGDKFPHLYGDLLLSQISQHWEIAPGARGRYDLSEIL